jgi:protein TonB
VLIDRFGHAAVLEQISGDPGLGKAAADAVEQWVYNPYILNGDYVDVETTVTVNFRL